MPEVSLVPSVGNLNHLADPDRRGAGMDRNVDDAKGRVKEAVGDLTDNEDLKREGKLDRAGATIKDKASEAADKVAGVVDKAKAKLTKD
jgi:uncharacterized protein YjbJ (UPF0337 family)